MFSIVLFCHFCFFLITAWHYLVHYLLLYLCQCSDRCFCCCCYCYCCCQSSSKRPGANEGEKGKKTLSPCLAAWMCVCVCRDRCRRRLPGNIYFCTLAKTGTPLTQTTQRKLLAFDRIVLWLVFTQTTWQRRWPSERKKRQSTKASRSARRQIDCVILWTESVRVCVVAAAAASVCSAQPGRTLPCIAFHHFLAVPTDSSSSSFRSMRL